uniref:Uncharacterized protein n=1 Tax=uncultured proteobacterium QS1 TaxID=288647 RepID=Q6B361_9PROT|nr:hypothetical protein qs148 [uncultured proteobacterium QS1]
MTGPLFNTSQSLSRPSIDWADLYLRFTTTVDASVRAAQLALVKYTEANVFISWSSMRSVWPSISPRSGSVARRSSGSNVARWVAVGVTRHQQKLEWRLRRGNVRFSSC